MEEKIKALYETINFIGFNSTYKKDFHYMENVKKILPEVQKFATWFLNDNSCNLEPELYEKLSKNLLEILKDCIQAVQENDRVLLTDALEQGVQEYLKMFLPDNYWEEMKTKYVREEETTEFGSIGKTLSRNEKKN